MRGFLYALLLIPVLSMAGNANSGKIPAGAKFLANENPNTESVLSEEFFPVSGSADGIVYRRHGDGSATFGVDLDLNSRQSQWEVLCMYDGFDDTAGCGVRQRQLFIFIDKRCVPAAHIGNNNYPGTNVAARIESQKPIISDTKSKGVMSETASLTIQKALSANKKLLIRYREWPDRAWTDENIDPTGFALAFKYTCWAAKNLGKP